jgi:hypothetical protein
LTRSYAWIRACIALETSEIEVGSRKLQNRFISYELLFSQGFFMNSDKFIMGKKKEATDA